MYRKASKGWTKHIDFILLDLVCLYVSFFLVYCIRNGSANLYDNVLYLRMVLVLFLGQIFVSVFFNSFKNIVKRGYFQEFIATFQHVLLITLFAAFYLFMAQEGNGYSRLILVFTGVVDLFISYLVRCFWKRHILKRNLAGGDRSLLILTSQNMLDVVVRHVKKNNYDKFNLAGVALMDVDMVGQTVDGVPVVASADTVLEYVCREWVDEVFVNLPKELPLSEKLMNKLIESGVTVHLKLMRVHEMEGQKQNVERLGSYTVLTSSINMASARELLYKRLLDILGGLVGCILTGVLFIFVAPMIYIQSPGPIFFSQIRVGKNGRKFKIYKFRSMYMDAEERKKELMKQNRIEGGLMFKMEDDPRIIGGKNGIGGIIRRFSIDEFPQFWNVLKGDMSLVGTRPPTVDEWEKYDLHHRARLAIKPGITGMWQVSGRSEITDFDQVVELDKKYIMNWSMGLDLKILFRTVMVVLGQDGSM